MLYFILYLVTGFIIGALTVWVLWKTKDIKRECGNLIVKKDPDDGQVYLFMEVWKNSINDILTMNKVQLIVKPETPETTVVNPAETTRK